MKGLILTSIFSLFLGISNKDLVTEKETDNLSKMTILEISFGGRYSLKLIDEGLLCRSFDLKKKNQIKFYRTENLNYDNYLKLDSFLDSIDLFEMDSIYELPNVKIYSSFNVDITYVRDNNCTHIKWLSGKNENLATLLSLVNDLIPEKDREKFKIEPSWNK